jgi:hypothetical protein
MVVDWLLKHANFIPTTTELNTEDFGCLFVNNIACRFGLPLSIIMDRDPQWTSDFWKGAAKFLQMKMSLSSSQGHLQHNRQTEIVNKALETML